jgi:hypothetical protein
MKTLTLSIKQTFFDQILAGTKTVETREIKPSNATRYVYFVDSATNTQYKSWKDIPDGVGDIVIEPVSYDALKLLRGASKGTSQINPEGTRPSCLVEVKGAEIFFLMDENNDKIFYDDDLEFPAMVIDYQLGAIL